ncbi:DUF6232 family protein [Streptomyces sp. NPDC019937]|uniref:DUF6232 family protein n=1 Tax=Streptomyces sp. NPDC019937 TaxID=3154787 RepID=UPI00340233A7
MTSADSAGKAWDTPSGAASAAGGPPPTAPPPPPTAPPQPSAGPPPAADPHPDVAPAAAQPIIGVNLRVSRRLLWVGEAYYPIQNIARVHTLTIHPRRKEAVALFVKRLLLIGAVMIFLGLLAAAIDSSGGFGSNDGGGSPGLTALVLIVAAAALIYSLMEMIKVLSAPSHFVLAVETSGLSTAVVTSPHPDQLRWVAHQIADAIENPTAEFEVRVDTITVSPTHYYFGDNVNMYGGTGNVGMAS